MKTPGNRIAVAASMAAAGLILVFGALAFTQQAIAQGTAPATGPGIVRSIAHDAASDATDLQALRDAVKADKKAFVASNLDLTPVEAQKFWPIYDQFQRALAVVNRERAVSLEGLLSRGQPMTNAYAKQLGSATLAADDDEIRARHRLYNRLIRVLPAIKAARYLQLEGKIRAVQAYDIAAAIPLIR